MTGILSRFVQLAPSLLFDHLVLPDVTLAGDRKTLADQADPSLVLECAQGGYGRRDGIANLQHAEAVPVKELKARVVRAQLSPQLPHTEPSVAHIRIVE